MGFIIPVQMKAVLNRLPLCVLEDLIQCFDKDEPGYETLLAAFDHAYDPERLSAEDSLRVIQNIQQTIIEES